MLRDYLGDGVDDPGKRDPPGQERVDAFLVGRVVDGRRGAAAAARLLASGTAGNASSSSGSNVQVCAAVQSTGLAAPGTRSGQPSASAIGIRMSGGLAWAMVEPSVNSTIEWITDWRCTTTSMPSKADPEQQVRLDQLQALVHQRGGVDRDHRAHVPGRVRQRLGRRGVGHLVPGPVQERAAAGGHHQLAHLVGPAAAQALGDRRVLGVHRDDLAGRRPAGDQRGRP